MNNSIVLSFKEKDLDIIASTKVPPIVYTLPKGVSRKTVSYPDSIGKWSLMWVNTRGDTHKGGLMLIPSNMNGMRQLFNTRVKYYQSFGFKEFEATTLAKVKVDKYWCPNNMKFLYELSTNVHGLSSVDDLRVKLPELAVQSNISNRDALHNYMLLESIKNNLTMG